MRTQGNGLNACRVMRRCDCGCGCGGATLMAFQPYRATARAYARHARPGIYEVWSVRTGELLEMFEVVADGDLVPLFPPPEPPAARVAALLAA